MIRSSAHELTESFSTIALLPMKGELSQVIIEWSR